MNPTTPTTPNPPTSDWREETAALRATIKAVAEEFKAATEESIKRSQEAEKRSEANHQREMARIQAETDRLDKSNREYRERTIRMLAGQRTRIAARLQNHEGLRTNISRGVEDAFAVSFSNIMKDRYGVALDEVLRRVQKENHRREIDILGLNGKVAVVGEAKIRVRQKEVNDFESRLRRFRDDFPEHSRETVYGVIAGMAVDEDAADLARKLGLVVLCMDGGVPAPSTPKNFRPRPY